MKLTLKGCTDPEKIFHLPTDVGKVLVAAGLIEEIVDPPAPILPTRWLVINGGAAGEYEPYLKAVCPECHKEDTCESKVGTAHKTLVFRHCRRVETCPPEVVDRYLAAFNHFARTFRPKLFAKLQEKAEAIRSHGVVWR